jgi:CRISPR-associated endonuclease/helicase Cas3
LYFIDYKEIIAEKYPLYAHLKDDGKYELLNEHIKRCEYYFEQIDKEKDLFGTTEKYFNILGFENTDKALSLLKDMLSDVIVFHDFGKSNPVFQREKMKNKYAPKEPIKGLSGSQHSFFSAIMYIDYFWEKIESSNDFEKDDRKNLRMLVLEHAFVIARHHSDISSFWDFVEKFRDNETKELLKGLFCDNADWYNGPKFLTDKMLDKTIHIFKKQKENKTRTKNITEYFYIRFVYSVLVACDYYATTDFKNDIHKRDFGTFNDIDKFKKAYESSDVLKSIRKYENEAKNKNEDYFEKIDDINILRDELFIESEKEFEKYPNENIYFLEAPTGSGKSNVSINLSFKMMQNGKKIFYIYPFNTLVEQNRQNLEKVFEEDELKNKIAVVNSLTPIKGMEDTDEDSYDYYQKALLDRQFLNYPVVLSTHISFFKQLFGSRKEDVFGFVQFKGAVVVLDEIQSYKNSIWAEIIIFLKACASLMDMKIIIMSATLPNLEYLGGEECKVKYLLPDSEKYFMHKLFKNRVQISYELIKDGLSLDELMEHVLLNFEGKRKVLVEFIKKDTAYEFYHMLSEKVANVLCLTGDDSIYEREKILEPIKNGNDGVILVSTQVVEAGVDIDMDVGYKDISKLDSEEQFLGRINRSCRKNGTVYFFDIDKAQGIYRDDCRMDEELTLKNTKMREALTEKKFRDYYTQVLDILKHNRNESTDRNGLEYFFGINVKFLDFPEIQKRMRLIDKNMTSVVLCRKIELKDKTMLDGKQIWDEYKSLLRDAEMDYAEKQVKLSEVRSLINNFIYQIYSTDINYNDVIGELYCIYDADKYFENGKLNRKKFESEGALFID